MAHCMAVAGNLGTVRFPYLVQVVVAVQTGILAMTAVDRLVVVKVQISAVIAAVNQRLGY